MPSHSLESCDVVAAAEGGCPYANRCRNENSNEKSNHKSNHAKKGTMKTLIVILVAMLALVSLAGAQTAPAKKAPAKPAASAPTKVTGEPTKTASGLQYWDIKGGTGAVAQVAQRVMAAYTGRVL